MRFLVTSFGIALLMAGLFFHGGSASPSLQAMPTPDRLAEPTLPPAPSQADYGAQVYWLSCLPCHGDRGQGLTDEFRAAYPPEEQYCWERGCHGENPYESGFTLPKSIPAVIAPGALQKFSNAAVLYAYIRGAMPFWKPGSLTDEEAWSVTAFILRQNGLWDGAGELNASNASEIKIQREPPTPLPTPPQAQVEERSGAAFPLALFGAALALLVVALLWRRNHVRNASL
jgi:mono/diheme cytochrome c family protein